MEAALEYYNSSNYTYTGFQMDRINDDKASENVSSRNTSDDGSEKTFHIKIAMIIDISTSVICFIGLVGNGIVIWLLGFCIKTNPFITYILNLAVADFGFLVTIIFGVINGWLVILCGFNTVFFLLTLFLSLSMHSACQFLLTAISLDRCVAVFFPLWHQCHRPPHLSTFVCAVVWALSFLLSAITSSILKINPNESMAQLFYQLVVNSVLCVPLMTIATGALFTKMYFKVQPNRRGKLLTIILLTLLCFLLLVFPLNVIYILYIYNYVPSYLPSCAMVLSCINSSVNPLIYFLFGRQWKTKQKETMKMILQRVFKEE